MPTRPTISGGQLPGKPLARVAVVAPTGEPGSGRVALMVASSSGVGLTVEKQQDVPVGQLEAALAPLKADAVVGVLDASQTPLRMVPGPGPSGEPAEIVAALALIAEANLPAALPEHRRTAGVLRAGAAQGVCAVGWTGGVPEGLGSVHIDAWVPPPVALAALLAQMGGPGCVQHVEARTGMILTATASGSEVRLRAVREDAQDQPGFDEAVRAAWHSAAAFTGADGASGGLPGASGGAWSANGGAKVNPPGVLDSPLGRLMLGAAAAAMPSATGARSLLTMTADAPVIKAQPLVGLVQWLGRPRVAAAMIVLSLAGLVLAPLGLAYARRAVLLSQISQAPGTDAQYDDARKLADFYTLLKDRRWPITQLLGEVIGSAPAGVSIDTVGIEQGQPIRLTGTTTADDLVREQWRKDLLDSGAFREVNVVSIDNTSPPTRFTLELRVGESTLALSREAAKLPPVARPPQAEVTADAHGTSTSAGATRADLAGGSTRTNRTGREDRSSTTATPRPAVAIPDELTDAQIDAMDRPTATREWARRRGMLSNDSIDQAVRDRLRVEADKLDARRKIAPSPGGGA